MGRNTIADVREIVDHIDATTSVSLSFNAWGSGQNKYQLVNEETGEQYGPTCTGASEFIKVMRGFQARGRIE